MSANKRFQASLGCSARHALDIVKMMSFGVSQRMIDEEKTSQSVAPLRYLKVRTYLPWYSRCASIREGPSVLSDSPESYRF